MDQKLLRIHLTQLRIHRSLESNSTFFIGYLLYKDPLVALILFLASVFVYQSLTTRLNDELREFRGGSSAPNDREIDSNNTGHVIGPTVSSAESKEVGETTNASPLPPTDDDDGVVVANQISV